MSKNDCDVFDDPSDEHTDGLFGRHKK